VAIHLEFERTPRNAEFVGGASLIPVRSLEGFRQDRPLEVRTCLFEAQPTGPNRIPKDFHPAAPHDGRRKVV